MLLIIMNFCIIIILIMRITRNKRTFEEETRAENDFQNPVCLQFETVRRTAQTVDKVHYRYISGIPGISLRWALSFLLSVYLVWKELFDPGAAKSPVRKRAQTDEKKPGRIPAWQI